MPITSVKFKNFKALRNYSVSLRRMNVLVGPNNSGKSTIVSAFRLLEQALRTASARRPYPVQTHEGFYSKGHVIPENTIPISLENVHYNYDDSDSRIEIRYSSGNKLFLFFPASGGVIIYWDIVGKSIDTTTDFRNAFPEVVQVIPVLGPLEQEELIVQDETVRRAAGTQRASRHFRNYWWKYPDGFDDFKKLVEETWPGMSIGRPELVEPIERRLTMYASENRIDRELHWAGLGFQIWCQLLTHIARCSKSNLLIVDEPEIYLHPELQRQLLAILRDVNPDILLATHSVEILGEAEPTEILMVDKKLQSARRLQDVEGVQHAIDSIGSVQNITLTQLARNRRLLFVEGLNDYKIIRRFARLLGLVDLAVGTGVTVLESGGFDSWPKVEALAWGFRKTLGSDLQIAAVYDPDYRCKEESDELKSRIERHIEFAHFHIRKEIENYLLSPRALERAAIRAIEERARRVGASPSFDFDMNEILELATRELKTYCSGQYISKYNSYFKDSGRDPATLTSEALGIFENKWNDLEARLEIVPGNRVLKSVRELFQQSFGITLTDIRIIDAFVLEDIPRDLRMLIRQLNNYRNPSEVT